MRRLNLLFLSRWFPCPPENGARVRIFNLLRELARRHRVTVISMVEEGDSVDLAGLEEVVDRAETVDWRRFDPSEPHRWTDYFEALPRSVVRTHSPDFEAAIRRAVERERFDCVVASQIETALYREAFEEIPAVFDEVEVAVPFERWARRRSRVRRLRGGMTWWKHRRLLRSLLHRFDACTTASAREKALVEQRIGAETRVEVVPNPVDVSAYGEVRAEPTPDEWVYCGSVTYAPNLEAVDWFIRETLPLVLEEAPEFRLRVTGGLGSVAPPKHAAVEYTGRVEDVRPVVAGSWGEVVPLRSGGGTRIKILEAMALGTPVVSTSKGAEGIEAAPGRDILIGDTPREIADGILRLRRDPELRQAVAEAGRRRVAELYDAPVAAERLLALIDEVVGRAAGTARTSAGALSRPIAPEPRT